jgi:hypothetical protein
LMSLYGSSWACCHKSGSKTSMDVSMLVRSKVS